MTDGGTLEPSRRQIRNSTAEFLIFTAQSGDTSIETRYEDETVWLTQKLMAELFGVDVRTVSEHLRNIFAAGELAEAAVLRKFRTTAADGKTYATQHYNLDAIISVGYRVSSVRATQFRQWATTVLRDFALRGYVLDRKRLENGTFLSARVEERTDESASMIDAPRPVPSESRPRRAQLRGAAILILIQGIAMEASVFVGVLTLFAFGVDETTVTSNAHVFALPYLQDNLYAMMILSGIFAALRITGAIGLLRNRMWGLGLSLINCAVTLTLMVFLLPAGIADGVLSGVALVLILLAWQRGRQII